MSRGSIHKPNNAYGLYTGTMLAIQTISFCHRMNNLIKWQMRHKRKIGECVVRGQAKAPSCVSLRVDIFICVLCHSSNQRKKDTRTAVWGAIHLRSELLGSSMDGILYFTNLFVGLHAHSDKNNQVFSLSTKCWGDFRSMHGEVIDVNASMCAWLQSRLDFSYKCDWTIATYRYISFVQ